MRDRIIAPIALGVSRVTEKDTREGTRSKFMRRGGGNTRITKTTENTKTII